MGPRRDLVLLNAGAALYVGGLASSLGDGVERAARAVDSGAACELLDRLVATTAQLGG
jgi:anthranilate phosphoribosyltransferase